MSKLTAKTVEKALPNKEGEYTLPDGRGLFLRVRSTGSKSWLYYFRLPNDRSLKKIILGSVKDISLKEAREKLIELRKLVDQGVDPRTARAAAKADNTQAISMQALFDSWIGYAKIAGEMDLAWVKRHENRWDLHLKKPLGSLLAKDINRSHLAAALEAMTRKGVREETRKALTTLNLMLDYGVTRHIIDQNYARSLKPKDFAATANRPRDRALSILELHKLWSALDRATLGSIGIAKTATLTIVTATAIKLLILTGARRGEVAGMRWDELDLKASIWVLPCLRTKNRQGHTLYLSKQAIKLILALQSRTSHSPFVFDTGCYADHGHIHEDTLTGVISRLRGTASRNKKKANDIVLLTDVDSFTIHDLRRSAATAWGEYLKVAPHVIERMLNHQPENKLIATYQRAVYADEQKSAWLAWGAMIEQQIAHHYDNVLPIKRSS